MNKKMLYMYAGVIVVGLMISEPIYAMGGQGMGGGMGSGGQDMIDKNNNGIPDGMEDFDGDGISNREDDDFDKEYINMKDADEDGIANREDEDYEPVGDGTGRPETGGNNQMFKGVSEIEGETNNSVQMQEQKQEQIQIQSEEQELESTQAQKRIMNQKNNAAIIGKIQAMTQSREQLQQEIADDVVQLQGQGNFGRFLKGVDHDVVEHANAQINQYEEKINQLKELSESTTNIEDKNLIDEQIIQMETMSVKMQELIAENSKNFNLFEWMTNIFN